MNKIKFKQNHKNICRLLSPLVFVPIVSSACFVATSLTSCTTTLNNCIYTIESDGSKVIFDYETLFTPEAEYITGYSYYNKKKIYQYKRSEFNKPVHFSAKFDHFSLENNFLANCPSFNQEIDLSACTKLMYIGDNFLALDDEAKVNSKFNSVIKLPTSLISVGNNFLFNNAEFNQSLNTANIQYFGDYFLAKCPAFDQSLDFTNAITIGDNFMYACEEFNKTIIFSDNLLSIGNAFLGMCISFDSQIDLKNIITIGEDFLIQCESFNQNLTLPLSLTSLGTRFMWGCNNFVSTLDFKCIIYKGRDEEGNLLPTIIDQITGASLSTLTAKSPIYVTGFKVNTANAVDAQIFTNMMWNDKLVIEETEGEVLYRTYTTLK